MSVWGVSVVAILDSSVNCAFMWSTNKLTMPAYCVAANCNNSQTTPGIAMHELPRNRPAVRRKWIKFIQFKRADFLAAPICVASTSVSAILQTPWNTACRSWHDVSVLFQNPAWQAQDIQKTRYKKLVTRVESHANAVSLLKSSFVLFLLNVLRCQKHIRDNL